MTRHPRNSRRWASDQPQRLEVPTKVLDLHWQQGGVYRSKARFKVLAAGRRWGKTTLMKAALLESAGERGGPIGENWHAYIAPDLVQARRVMWRPLLDSVPRSWMEREPNQTRMEIPLVTGQMLVCLGADNPDSLRGMGFRRVVLDEYADMPGPKIWEPIILPALLTSNGDALIGGTPKGFDHFYELWRRGQEGWPHWENWRFATREAPHITEEMYEALVAEYVDERIMRQELEASFESASGTILGHLWQEKRAVRAGDKGLLKIGLKVGDIIPWHVIPKADWIPPRGALIYGSVDYGFGKPAALYLHAALAGGHIRTFWEFYKREVHDDQQAQHLRQAIEYFAEKGVDLPEWIVLEPVMFGVRREYRIAKSIAEVYGDELRSLTQIREGAGGRAARLSRPQRWMTALAAAPDGLPWWTCTTACPHLIRTVRYVRWAENDPEVDEPDGENHCLVAGTLVDTKGGPMPIEDVQAGDRVRTRTGYRPVLRAWLSDSNAAVYDVVCSDGRVLRGTGHHRVWVQSRGWTRIDKLANGFILNTWASPRASSAPRFRSGAAFATTCKVATSLANVGHALSRRVWGASIVTSGRTCTALFPWASKCITQTRTGRTTLQVTLSRVPAAHISLSTASDRQNVSAAPEAETPPPQPRHGWRWLRCRSCAPNAADQRWRRLTLASDSVLNAARRRSMNAVERLVTACRSIRCTALAAIARLRRPGRASDSAATLSVITVRPSGRAPVYDLTVADPHEFYANGILVHNSYESVGRFFEARPIAPRVAPADPYKDLDPVSRAHHQAMDKQQKGDRRGGLAGIGNLGGRR